MTFYSISYIQNSQSNQQTIITILIILALGALIVFAILYLRDRFATKYRDLGIIALLFLLLFAGIQYEKYINIRDQRSQATQIVPFIKSVAKDESVNTNDVVVSSTVLTNGMIVRINSKNVDYQLNLNDDNNTYTLTRAHVVDHHVEVKR